MMSLKLILPLLLQMLGSIFKKKHPQNPQSLPVIQKVESKKIPNEQFFFELGAKYFDNWILGEPIIIDPKIEDPQSIYKWIDGFNSKLSSGNIDNIRKFKERVDLLFELATVIRNVEGIAPTTVGASLGQLLVRLRTIDGERFDREVLKIVKKK